ncbi:MAG TPA: transposase [Desulfoprunum sp.]|nr:transposase [Desulfoprunum sp.]
MSRISRIIAPGLPHHIAQRGNNRAPVFFADDDRETYLDMLTFYATRHSMQIWAYCLMENHLHILAVPERADSLARGIGITNQVYTQYINRRMHHSGHLWQNRFFSCIVGGRQHLWQTARYIERNPIRIGLAAKAEEYPWSSARAHTTGTRSMVLSNSSWLAPNKRPTYTAFLRLADNVAEEAIRRATRTGRPFAADNFIDDLERQLQLPLHPKRPGRPPKRTQEEASS